MCYSRLTPYPVAEVVQSANGHEDEMPLLGEEDGDEVVDFNGDLNGSLNEEVNVIEAAEGINEIGNEEAASNAIIGEIHGGVDDEANVGGDQGANEAANPDLELQLLRSIAEAALENQRLILTVRHFQLVIEQQTQLLERRVQEHLGMDLNNNEDEPEDVDEEADDEEEDEEIDVVNVDDQMPPGEDAKLPDLDQPSASS
ncbi:hypothetical protein GCK72_006360 [Caenorhabditis remanei]|uniref:Uncharacterized protein n=1 Tax=Caenorhabditis remanei TaxID=31234 RepID=A0A6A5HJ51_CAERE|nr:hypothetical protein GCK72_006360 [Caenorhabditis remanei]KAF1766403.1 hypothetical protein GCK72_006360 [Caenorhabditis remanei]